jgi:hypothetical protein
MTMMAVDESSDLMGEVAEVAYHLSLHNCRGVVTSLLHLGLSPFFLSLCTGAFLLSINLPVVYMGRDVWIWMGCISYRGPFEGVGPEIETFLGPEMATSAASAIWAQKSRVFPNM